MSAPNLLPCPFCGGPAEMWKAGDKRPAWIACMGRCAVLISKEHATDAEALATWNTRADLVQSQIDAAVEAERERWAAIAEAILPPDGAASANGDEWCEAYCEAGQDLADAIRKGGAS